MIFASNLKRFPKRSHWPLFLKANQARLYVASGNGALSHATSTMGERFYQMRPQEEALRVFERLRKKPFKIVGGVMKVIRQNYDIRNMRCQNGNARKRSSATAA